MLMAIDIGNTNITIGMFDGEQLKATWRIATPAVPSFASRMRPPSSRGPTYSRSRRVGRCSGIV